MKIISSISKIDKLSYQKIKHYFGLIREVHASLSENNRLMLQLKIMSEAETGKIIAVLKADKIEISEASNNCIYVLYSAEGYGEFDTKFKYSVIVQTLEITRNYLDELTEKGKS